MLAGLTEGYGVVFLEQRNFGPVSPVGAFQVRAVLEDASVSKTVDTTLVLECVSSWMSVSRCGIEYIQDVSSNMM